MTAWTLLRSARYALPRQLEKLPFHPGARAALRICERLSARGFLVTAGYFQSDNDGPDAVLAANLALIEALRKGKISPCLSVKAPALGFDEARLITIARTAADAGMAIMLDSLSPAQAEQTLFLAESLLAQFPGTGCALPARWQRSTADADRLYDTSAAIRIVKGEWADDTAGSAIEEAEPAQAFIALVNRLAGRAAPVAVATHDPALARRALTTLQEAGTPCLLEQLRGLPRRQTTAIARELGVPVRIYVPSGPGWWPYAADKALARPYLLKWMVADWLG